MPEKHLHFYCENCDRVFCSQEAAYAELRDGDACPLCHIKVVREIPTEDEGMPAGVIPPELAEGMMKGFDRAITQQRKRDRERKAAMERMHTINERQAAALEAIAQSLATIASAITVDDLGNAAIRIVGDLIGGEGDIPAGLEE